MNPRADGAGALGLCIPASDFVAVATRPHDVWIREIGKRETGFASTHAALPAGVHHTAVLERRRDAGAAHIRAVLHVGVDVVRNLIVDGDVIHLTNWKLNALEAAPVNGGDVQAAVVGDDEAVGI